MLEDIDKPLPFDGGIHLKASLQLPIPACDASVFSSPIEQQRMAVLLDQSALSLTEVSAEMGLDFGMPGPTTSSPESQCPWKAAATMGIQSLGSCSDLGNRGGNSQSPYLQSGSLIFCECYTVLQDIGFPILVHF